MKITPYHVTFIPLRFVTVTKFTEDGMQTQKIQFTVHHNRLPRQNKKNTHQMVLLEASY